MKAELLPTFYISHGGGPCFWINWDPPNLFSGLAASLQELPKLIKQKPKAILVISAHWEAPEFNLQTHPNPPMLYDYYGFPEHTYKLQYPATTSPWLAQQVKSLLTKANIPLQEDPIRGFDHGLFVPFLKIYPNADIPIMQISLKSNLNPKEHLNLGKALEPLRSEGVLLVGSGYSYHNLRNIPDKNGDSHVFDSWLTEVLCEAKSDDRYEKLARWENAPAARKAHPREEHLLPLMVVVGAANEELGQKIYSELMPGWNIQMSSFQFG